MKRLLTVALLLCVAASVALADTKAKKGGRPGDGGSSPANAHPSPCTQRSPTKTITTKPHEPAQRKRCAPFVPVRVASWLLLRRTVMYNASTYCGRKTKNSQSELSHHRCPS